MVPSSRSAMHSFGVSSLAAATMARGRAREKGRTAVVTRKRQGPLSNALVETQLETLGAAIDAAYIRPVTIRKCSQNSNDS
jgi:hypothetical protein